MRFSELGSMALMIIVCGAILMIPASGLQEGERLIIPYTGDSSEHVFEAEIDIGTVQADWTIEGQLNNDHDDYEVELWLAELEEEGSVRSLSTIDLNNYEIGPGENQTILYDEYLGFSGGEVTLTVEVYPVDPEADQPDEITLDLFIEVLDAEGNVMIPFEEMEIAGEDNGGGGGSSTPGPGIASIMIVLGALLAVGMVLHRRRKY